MIPLKLKLKGIYSYKEIQTIDFEKLTKTQLFGIFGTTGSGKSSILEAITFALYGEVERLTRNERNYNMMNLDCNEMYIALEFRAGVKGQEKFMAEVSGKRNSKNFDTITVNKSLYHFTKEKWEPFTGKIEEITGLSYENFRRTIIIPQGNFQEFIQLGEKDRTEMMKKLFHLEKYDLAGKTKSLAEKNQKKQDEKETLLNSLAEYNPESLKEIGEKIQEKEQDSEKLAAVIALAEKEYKEIQENERVFVQLEEKKLRLSEMESKAEDFATKEKALQEYEYCEKNFAPVLKEKKKLDEELKVLEKSISHKSLLLSEKKQELNKRKETFKEIEKNYGKRTEYKEKQKELETTADIIRKYLEQQDEREKVEKGKQLTQSKKEELETYKKQNQDLGQQITALTQTIQDVQPLREVRDWFKEGERLAKEQNDIKKHLDDYSRKAKQLGEEKQLIVSVLKLNALFEDLETKEIRNLIEEELGKVRAQEKEYFAKQYEWNIHLSLKQYAENLREGDPCPVCGSQHHPGITGRANPEGKLALIQEEMTRNTQYQNALHKAQVQLEGWEKNNIENQQKIKETGAEIQAKNTETEAHLSAFRWEIYREKSLAEIETTLQEESEIRDKLTELNEKREDTEKRIRKNDEELDRYEKRLKELEAKENERQGYLTGKISTLNHITWEQYRNVHPDVIHKEAEDFGEKYSGAENAYKTYRDKIQEEQEKINVLEGEVNEANNHQKDLLVESIHKRNELTRLIASSPFENQQKIEEILRNPFNVGELKQEIEDYKINLGVLQTEIAGLIAESEGKIFNREEMENLEKKIKEYKDEQNGLQQEIGGLGNKKKETEEKLTEKARIEKEYTELKYRGENIESLSKMFKAMGFVNYVSFAYLKQLCFAANERFQKLTQGMLQLEVTEDGKLQVRDYFNNGKTRSIKTLSGGQTFQAALSLALALADSVHQQSGSDQNFFFIDEGFGSQDKDSLRMIFQTLQSLKNENRIVGIISHVEELQQEIETYLQIYQDNEKGSIIKEGWLL